MKRNWLLLMALLLSVCLVGQASALDVDVADTVYPNDPPSYASGNANGSGLPAYVYQEISASSATLGMGAILYNRVNIDIDGAAIDFFNEFYVTTAVDDALQTTVGTKGHYSPWWVEFEWSGTGSGSAHFRSFW